MDSKNKVEAIYELRTAAEEKALAEQDFHLEPSSGNRAAFLEAQMTLEEKTVTAIDVCHECGHEHSDTEQHRTRND